MSDTLLKEELSETPADKQVGSDVLLADFGAKAVQAIEGALLKQISDCRFIEHHHPKKRHVPEDIVDQVWSGIDWDRVVSVVTEQLQDRIASTIAQAMITEAKTDAKAVLSIEGVRQRLRAEAYPKIMESLR